MLEPHQGKKMSKEELVELCLKVARENKPRFSKNGKPHIPDGYKKSLARMSKARLIEEYNALCLEG